MKIVTVQDANRANCCPCDWPLCEPPQKECQSLRFSGLALGFLPIPPDGYPDIYDRPGRFLTQVNTYVSNPPADVMVEDPDGFPMIGTHFEGVFTWTATKHYNASFYAINQCEQSGDADPTGECAGGGTQVISTYAYYFHDGGWTSYVSQVITSVLEFVGGEETPEHIAWLAADPETRGAEPLEFYPPCTPRITNTYHRNLAPDESGDPPEDFVDVTFPDALPSDSVTSVYSDEVTWLAAHEAIQAWVNAHCDFSVFDDSGSSDYCGPEADCNNKLVLGRAERADPSVYYGGPVWTYLETRCRYRYGIPASESYAGYTEAHDAWVIAHAAFPALHAAWAAEDPHTRGSEPVDPVEPHQRSVYELTWDEMEAPSAWWTWYYDGMHGDEPTPSHVLLAEREWVWDGDLENAQSPWFEMPGHVGIPDPSAKYLAWIATMIAYFAAYRAWEPVFAAWSAADPHVGDPPVAPTVPLDLETEYIWAETANLMILCWRSTRLGNKPTCYGDQVAIPSA